MDTKTHYRKVFKSDHLGSADLEEMLEDKKPLVFTIAYVKSHFLDPTIKGSGITVAGRRISANIAHFKEDIKPLVLNATNSKTVKGLLEVDSPFVEDWKNIEVELYVDKFVKMKGETVGGVRIMKPKVTQKPTLTKEMPAYQKAVDHLKGEGIIVDIENQYILTDQIKEDLQNDTI